MAGTATAAAPAATGETKPGADGTPTPQTAGTGEKPSEQQAAPKTGEQAPTKKTDDKPGDNAPARVVPDTYTDFELPEGYDADDVATVLAEAKAAGLTQNEAQAIVDARLDSYAKAAETYATALKADKELGGDKLPETERLAKLARDVMFPPKSEGAAFADRLFKTGAGNHPELVRAFVRIGKLLAEDKPGRTTATDAPAQQKSTADVLYDGNKARKKAG